MAKYFRFVRSEDYNLGAPVGRKGREAYTTFLRDDSMGGVEEATKPTRFPTSCPLAWSNLGDEDD